MRRAEGARSRADLHAAIGVLLVLRTPPPPAAPVPGQPPVVQADPGEGPEILLAVWDDGSVTALHGHVDLGTGLRTALAQIVAEELELPMAAIHMVLGDTARVPNQGATIASASIQLHAEPLRRAAAQARGWLAARAAQRLQCPVQQLLAQDGKFRCGSVALSYGDLLAGTQVLLQLDLQTPVRGVQDYRVVGQSVPRLDLPDKLTGALVFVHDMRLPGMLHGRVVRPPYAGADHGDFIGNTLQSVDQASIAHIPGIRAVVVIRDFVGIVAQREEQAEQAMRELRVLWKTWPGMPDVQDLQRALRNNPSSRRTLVDEGDVDAALAQAQADGRAMARTYVWPYQMHASIGPSCALADWHAASGTEPERMTVWAGTQNPFVLRFDLARLLGLPDAAIDLVRMEAAGCYGRNGADDVAADAALLSRAVGAPVRVQLTREQEHLWEPKGAAQLMQVRGGLDADGSVAGYDFQTSYPSNGAPTLALLLTRSIEPVAQAFEMGDRSARPPYDFANLRVSVNDMAPLVRASWLRGVSALPNAFAHESYIDELASAAGVDPVEFRLRHLRDPRAAELVRATRDKAAWKAHAAPQQQVAQGQILHGQGFAYARYVHSKWPGFGAAWAAWVADVEVNRNTGEVHVRRVVVGHDAGLVINPAGIEQQVHGNVLQTTSRALKERVQFTPGSNTVASQEWGSYPILNFREVPVIEVLHMPRPGEPALGAGESSSVPGTAAIANAIFDATGVRLREPPFTPEVVRAALHPQATPGVPAATRPGAGAARARLLALAAGLPWPRRRSMRLRAGALFAGVLGLGALLLGGRGAVAPATPGAASVYSQATLERGRLVAAAGGCSGCHTRADGTANAGGRPIETPFGSVYSTNLTPDPDTGLGRWSFAAFERAMRYGLSRDGRHLYPAFPYTAFAVTSDADMVALYVHLMAQPPVRAETPAAQMHWPFSLRPLMALWNVLFHRPPGELAQPDPAAPSRGGYLVNTLGHCGSCHTPRNALGAERGGAAYLSGAMVDGWEAPALTALSHAPLPWTEDELFRYLRHGHTLQHGIAAGPMAPVVRELGALPDDDIRAMASYLAGFQLPGADPARAAATQPARVAGALPQLQPQPQPQPRPVLAMATDPGLPGPQQRMFDGACGACHHDGDGPHLLGLNLPLGYSSKLHSERPDNLLRVILHGIEQPAGPAIGFMPPFRYVLSDGQIAELAAYMRQRYAPDKAPWGDLGPAIRRARVERR